MRLKLGSAWEAGWSFDGVCDSCGNNVSECTCVKAHAVIDPAQHRLVFKKEKRRGKTVTLVGPFRRPADDLKTILSALKKKLGCGGALDGEWIEAQGEQGDRLRDFFVAQGYGLKQS